MMLVLAHTHSLSLALSFFPLVRAHWLTIYLAVCARFVLRHGG